MLMKIKSNGNIGYLCSNTIYFPYYTIQNWKIIVSYTVKVTMQKYIEIDGCRIIIIIIFIVFVIISNWFPRPIQDNSL